MVFHPFMNFMNTKNLNDSLVDMIIMEAAMIPTTLEMVLLEMATPETLTTPEDPTIDRPSSGMKQTKKSPLMYISL